jgi:MFS family permease
VRLGKLLDVPEPPPSVSLESAARRNLILLAAGMAALYGMVELVFGVAGITFEEVGGSEALEGLAPAIFIVCAGTAAFLGGRQMDRSGRRPVLLAGFAAGGAGCLLAALGVSTGSLVPVLPAFALCGAATGTVFLSRAAAADMYPPVRRPRVIALVLFGAVFGALLGPLVFSPILGEDESALDLAWVGGAGFMAVGLVVVSRLRPDPGEIGAAIAAEAPAAAGEAAPGKVLQLAAAPGVPPALLAVLASWTGMGAVMSLAGSALVDHGHQHDAVFPVLAAHFAGMFAFFAVVGRVIERIGRPRATALGLLLLAASSLTFIATIESVHLTALVLFGVGLGWSLSFVAATAELSERAPAAQRATLIGFGDLLGNLSAAAFVIAGGVALDAVGIGAVGIGAAVLPVLAAAWILATSSPSTKQAEASA